MKTVSLDAAGKPATFHRAHHINDLADHKNISLDDIAFFLGTFGFYTRFDEVLDGRDAFNCAAFGVLVVGLELAKMAQFTPRQLLRLNIAETKLDSVVTIVLGCLHLRDVVGTCFDHRHTSDIALRIEELGHTDLSTYQFFHDSSLALRPVGRKAHVRKSVTRKLS